MNCTRCTAPTADGIHLCNTCTGQLSDTLRVIPELRADLSVTTAKLDNHGGTGGSPGFQPTAPVNLTALETEKHLQYLIMSWAMMLLDYDRRPVVPHHRHPEAHLRAALPEIRHHDWAGEMHRELTAAVHRARQLIDRPRDIRILGRCQQLRDDDTRCGQQLKTDGERDIITCKGCGTPYYVTRLEEYNRERIRGRLMTVPEAKRWLNKNAGVKVTYDGIRNWIRHGHLRYVLARVTTGGRETKLVYPGDVLRVQMSMTDRRRDAQLA